MNSFNKTDEKCQTFYLSLNGLLSERNPSMLSTVTEARRNFDMKEKIHPKYEETTITCICGNVIHTRSTSKDIKVNTCSACHPFFTGTAKYVDAAGRVEQFNKRYGKK